MEISWPHNAEAEKIILGAIALLPETIKKIKIQEADFYSEAHRNIFRTMQELVRQGVPPDIGALLPKISHEESIRLNGYINMAVTSADLSYFEEIVREVAQKRSVQKLCLDIIRGNGETPSDESLSTLRKRSAEIMLAGNGDEIISSRELAGELWQFIEKRFENREDLSGIPSGLTDLDRFLDGWQPGDLIILAGRPGSGKSALGWQFAQEAAMEGNPAGFISLEMGTHPLGIRSLASLSNVEIWKIRKGLLSSGELDTVASTAEKLINLPIFISCAARDTGAISRTIAQMVEIHGCRLILLDYIQLVKSQGSKERREREVAEVSWMLKTAAQTHNIPVIALSQLNRDSEKQGRRPILSDLRESGAIEQDADVVMFLYQKENSENGRTKGPLEIIISKGRNVGTGAITVFFDSERMRFADYRDEN